MFELHRGRVRLTTIHLGPPPPAQLFPSAPNQLAFLVHNRHIASSPAPRSNTHSEVKAEPAAKMVRLTADLIQSSLSYLNPLKDRELDLRGAFGKDRYYTFDLMRARVDIEIVVAGM